MSAIPIESPRLRSALVPWGVDIWIVLSAMLLVTRGLPSLAWLGAAVLGCTLAHPIIVHPIDRYILKGRGRRFQPFLRLVAAASMTALAAPIAGFPGWPQVAAELLAVSAILGGCLYAFPAWVRMPSTLTSSLRHLWQYRMLILLWLKYSVLSRYAQAALGILWIMLLPLSTSVILALVFSQFLRVELTDVPFISFFLTALVPWSLFSQGIYASTTAVLAHMTLINQVPFPREVLVIRALGESLMDAAFMFVCMLLINALEGIFPHGGLLFLPLIVLIQACAMLGLMFFISALSVFVRDIPQLVAVSMQLLFYLTPIIYPVELVPEHLRTLLWLNPLSFVVQAYREIILYRRLPAPVNLYAALLGALLLLYMGYAFFKAREHRLADYV